MWDFTFLTVLIGSSQMWMSVWIITRVQQEKSRSSLSQLVLLHINKKLLRLLPVGSVEKGDGQKDERVAPGKESIDSLTIGWTVINPRLYRCTRQ